MSEPVRWVIPAILLVACLGIAVSLWWERSRPSAYTRRPREGADGLAVWSRMSVSEQAAADRRALDDAEDAARLAVQRYAEINTTFRP